MPYVTTSNGKVTTNSCDVADLFGKRHDNVLRTIDRLDCSPQFNALNFEAVDYQDAKGEVRRSVNMTKDGFVFLVMGFTGKDAARFKEAYIQRFNEMEEALRSRPRSTFGATKVREFWFGDHLIRGLTSQRGVFLVAVDLVYACYPTARRQGSELSCLSKPPAP